MQLRSNRQTRSGRRWSRAQLLIGLTAVLGIVFVATVLHSIRADRQNIEQATCMFAADASRVLQARARMHVEWAAEPLFAAVGGRAPLPAPSLPQSPAVLAQAAAIVRQCHCAPDLPATLFFRLDLAGDSVTQLTVVDPSDSVPSLVKPRIVAAKDSASLRRAIVEFLPQLRQNGVFAAGITGTKYSMDPLREVAVLMPKFDGANHLRAVYGLIIPPSSFVRAIVAPSFEDATLFSAILADTTPKHGWECCGRSSFRSRDVVNLEVDDYGWRPLYRTGPMPDTISGCLGMARPEPAFAGLLLELGPLPSTWERWVGRSLAISHAPVLVILFAGMVLCGVAAGVMAHRDAELANLRSDFVTSISHELRMPLAQILLAGETLSLGRTRTQSERDDAADAIVREAQRLSGLVDNVLFFSRIEHHNVQTNPVEANLADVVSDIVASVMPLAAGAGAFVSVVIPGDLSAMLDRSAFRQVMYNLLDNALKYGPPGQHVRVGAEAVSGSLERVRVWIEDEGPGIPREQESTIFEPFVRLVHETNTAVAGSGLGLAVVRHLVTSQGGRIWVEHPATGKGTRFVIELRRGGRHWNGDRG